MKEGHVLKNFDNGTFTGVKMLRFPNPMGGLYLNPTCLPHLRGEVNRFNSRKHDTVLPKYISYNGVPFSEMKLISNKSAIIRIDMDMYFSVHAFENAFAPSDDGKCHFFLVYMRSIVSDSTTYVIDDSSPRCGVCVYEGSFDTQLELQQSIDDCIMGGSSFSLNYGKGNLRPLRSISSTQRPRRRSRRRSRKFRTSDSFEARQLDDHVDYIDFDVEEDSTGSSERYSDDGRGRPQHERDEYIGQFAADEEDSTAQYEIAGRRAYLDAPWGRQHERDEHPQLGALTRQMEALMRDNPMAFSKVLQHVQESLQNDIVDHRDHYRDWRR